MYVLYTPEFIKQYVYEQIKPIDKEREDQL